MTLKKKSIKVIDKMQIAIKRAKRDFERKRGGEGREGEGRGREEGRGGRNRIEFVSTGYLT